MPGGIQPSSNHFSFSPKRLFLIDGIGAIISATFLGVILVRYNDFFGMPIHVLYLLAALACVFAIYSFSCHFLLDKIWKPYLKAIIITNLTYCLLTISLVIYFASQITTLGLIYFVLEIIIIFALVMFERKVYANLHQ